MTVSRAERLAAAAAFGVMLIGLSGDAAAAPESDAARGMSIGPLAQSDTAGPRRLLPRKPVAPEAETAPPSAPEEPQGPEVQPRSGIEINPLQSLDPEAAGTLDAASGGFDRSVWQGTPAGTAAHLMGQLPDAIRSPALRDLLRRLLLTAAEPPVREAGQENVSLLTLRIERLQAMGLLGSAAELLDLAPRRDGDGALYRLRAENMLLRGEPVAACAETRRPGIRLEERYWQYLLIFCNVLDGNMAEATLGANLLAESGDPADPVFMSLIDGLASGSTPTVEQLDAPTPLLAAMLRQANVPFPESALAKASPPLLAMIAASDSADTDLRLHAGEQAAFVGAMTPDRLGQLYNGVAFSGEDLQNALSIAEAVRSPRSRALLFQAAAAHDVPAARAEVLQKAMAMGREDGLYSLSAQVFRPTLEAMAPSTALTWFAADAARALLALGRADLAREWLVTLRYESLRDPTAKRAFDALWALTLVTAPQATEGMTGTEAEWREAVNAIAPERAAARIADSFALLALQGIPIDGDVWRSMLGAFETHPVQLPDHTYRAALVTAAQAGRVGETVLLAVILTGGTAPAELELTVLNDVVRALRAVGLADEARAVVTEAAVEKGI